MLDGRSVENEDGTLPDFYVDRSNESFVFDEAIVVETVKHIPSPLMSRKEGDDDYNLHETEASSDEADNRLNFDSTLHTFVPGKQLYSPKPSNPAMAERISVNTVSRPMISKLKTAANTPDSKENHQSLSENDSDDDDDDDDDDVPDRRAIKNHTLADEFDPDLYDLKADDEVKDLFQYITKYVPQQLTVEYRFKTFLPDFLPAVGDIDAFLKVTPPDSIESENPYHPSEIVGLGLAVLDEPAANQSDPALLYLHLKANLISIDCNNQIVKKIGNLESDAKIVEKWIKDVTDLHNSVGTATVKYLNLMPELETLMQEWPENVERFVHKSFPSPRIGIALKPYVDVICSVFDVPIYQNRMQSLHVLFNLYAAIKTSQLYKGAPHLHIKDVHNN